MKKVVYILPGFAENAKSKRYHKIIKFFKQKGFKIVEVTIHWEYRIMSDYVKEFLSQYNQHNKNDKVYLFGFSFGSMISFIASTQIKITAQFLCSLSPYFKEDMPYIKSSWKKSIGSNRVKDFSFLSFNRLAQQVKCKTYIFAGNKEDKEVDRRAREANKRIRYNELFIIDGAKHDIGQKEYVKKLEEIIGKI